MARRVRRPAPPRLVLGLLARDIGATITPPPVSSRRKTPKRGAAIELAPPLGSRVLFRRIAALNAPQP